MEQRRFILFITFSMVILIGWLNVGPMLFPGMFPKPRKPAVAKNVADDAKKKDAAGDQQKVKPVTEKAEQNDKGEAGDENSEQKTAENDTPKEPEINAPPKEEFAEHPSRTIRLGSLDNKTGFFLHVELTSRGAAVSHIALNDPRYKDLENLDQPLWVVGNDPDATTHTFETTCNEIDAQLIKHGATLASLNWEVIPDSQSDSAVTFQFTSPDGTLRIRKNYKLNRIDTTKFEVSDKKVRDTQAEPYWLSLSVSIDNLGDEQRELGYTLLGPVGIPLEDIDNTRKFRDIRMAYFDQGEVETASLGAGEVVEQVNDGKVEEWKQPLKYIGVDVQYFAALISPGGNQQKDQTVAVSTAELIDAIPGEPTQSDISIELQSQPIPLAAGETVEHQYVLYAGPRRQELLNVEPFGAGDIVDFGWFSAVSIAMLWVMNTLNGWGVTYGIAIIMLTVMVRGCMFPLSLKQAAGAKKMKELQPKLAELRKKYANDKEKMAKAQMELFSKNNYNPFAGCLPIFIQLPIFIGLYRSLGSSVDLRLAPFLWFDNLAAPDALFNFGFALPFLGETFNLLPIITVGLFIVQQKMFMPPPTDEQQAMQQQMMNYMMIFIGFMFYKVPAGLCVYFIASSCWGLAERKLLDFKKEKPIDEDEGSSEGPGSPKKNEPSKTGFWGRMAEQIDAATKKIESLDSDSKSNGSDKRSERKKKKARR